MNTTGIREDVHELPFNTSEHICEFDWVAVDRSGGVDCETYTQIGFSM